MTDDEINERVARIEGWAQITNGDWARPGECAPLPEPYASEWWACGPLVEKYKISVLEEWSGWVGCREQGRWLAETADTPQRAICFAVIALHEGKP